MKKNIMTKSAMTRIANSIENKLRDELRFWDSIEITRDGGDNYAYIEIHDTGCCIMSSVIMISILDVIEPYMGRYKNVFYVLDTTVFYNERTHEFMNTPLIRIRIA